MSDVNQYLLAFIETKHDTMCFNLATPFLNFELTLYLNIDIVEPKEH